MYIVGWCVRVYVCVWDKMQVRINRWIDRLCMCVYLCVCAWVWVFLRLCCRVCICALLILQRSIVNYSQIVCVYMSICIYIHIYMHIYIPDKCQLFKGKSAESSSIPWMKQSLPQRSRQSLQLLKESIQGIYLRNRDRFESAESASIPWMKQSLPQRSRKSLSLFKESMTRICFNYFKK